jgi:hypothetical protein
VKSFVRKSVLKKGKFDMDKINPIDFVHKCFIPSLFVVAKGDDFVKPHHGERMY